MKRGIAGVVAIGLVLSLGLVAGLHAQATTNPTTKLERLEGTVIAIDKQKSEIMIRQRKSTNIQWTVAYTPDTKFSKLNVAGTLDQVKVGLRLICEGSFGKDEKNKMTAARIDVRTDE